MASITVVNISGPTAGLGYAQTGLGVTLYQTNSSGGGGSYTGGTNVTISSGNVISLYNVKTYFFSDDYGAVGNNSFDNYVPFSNMMSAWFNAGGGTMLVGAGIYYSSHTLQNPYNFLPQQNAPDFILEGMGQRTTTFNFHPVDNTNVGCIQSLNAGAIYLSGYSIGNGLNSMPLHFIGLTQVHATQIYCQTGSSTNVGFQLGGTNAAQLVSTNTSFAGYPSSIRDCSFGNSAPGIFCGNSVTALVVEGNYFINCGTLASIVFNPQFGQADVYCLIVGNFYEMANSIKYGNWVGNDSYNIGFLRNAYDDVGGSAIAATHFESGTGENYEQPAYMEAPLKPMEDLSGGANVVMWIQNPGYVNFLGPQVTSSNFTSLTMQATNGFNSTANHLAAPVTITVTGSPFTYTSSGTNVQMVFIVGGTVTAIAVNGTTISSAALTGFESIPVQVGESVKVTYSSAPTMFWKPVP